MTELKDPVCGMTVTEQSKHMHEHAGERFYFCCAGCKTKFAASLPSRNSVYVSRSICVRWRTDAVAMSA
jgi:YHS domain-containing protein